MLFPLKKPSIKKEKHIKGDIRRIRRSSVSYLGLLIVCCKRNTRLLIWFIIFSLKLQWLFSDKGKSIKEVSLRIIMNTRIHVILKILLDYFGTNKKILKEWKGVHMEVKLIQALLPKRRRRTPNKESSRKWMKEQTHRQWLICDLLRH